ncbi:MAG: endopeptidase La [Pseudomonadota bacterium]
MSNESALQFLPVLPLRDVVIYPHMVTPLFVGRAKSIAALDAAMLDQKRVFLIAQCSSDVDEPGVGDLFSQGTVANVLQLLKLPDETIKVLVEGESRAVLHQLDTASDGYLMGGIEVLSEPPFSREQERDVMIRSIRELFEQYVKVNKKVPAEVLSTLDGIDDPSRLVDTIAVHMSLKLEEKQGVLEILDVGARFEKVMALIEGELDVLQVEKRIRGRVKQQMEKSQREYYLNEQMKAIQKELGELEDAPNEIEDLSRRVQEAGMPQEAFDKAQSELGKLRQMSPMSAEATVVRNYLDTLLGVPWVKRSRVKSDLAAAQKILDRDHFGLEKVKERILEYLAVQKRVRKLKGPILCLVGPPGVGKTSLGRSLAASTGRKFVRMSLGGLRDEAEIRGHRRTYIGSMPGKIVQNLSKAGTRNPLMLLDEIDKMSMDFRGDPSSAMLEVLDPEQNNSFADHYLEVDVDLSDVMFVATANSLNIPAPLLDRMEVIRIAGYTENEKLSIARRYLLPKAIKDNGLKADELAVPDEMVLETVRRYTREAGVRSLEREINKICRKAVKDVLTGDMVAPITVDTDLLERYLGVYKYRYGLAEQNDQVGQVTGLAWTEVGGELLTIEAGVISGKGKLHYTGQLGDVMQESIQAAHTVVRSRTASLGLEVNFYEKLDLHIHVPEGATPKDGPSAGIGMCTAMVSALTGIPVKCDVAMTGEITLRGEVLPIGGLKEKLLAANRGGISQVIIPAENEKDLAEVPADILDGLDVVAVRWIDEVLTLALAEQPKPLDPQPTSVAEVEAVGKGPKGSGVSKH